EQQDYKFLECDRVVRALQEFAGQQTLQYLGVNIDPGYGRIDRGGAQVEQARGAGPDKNDAALDVFLRNFSRQYLPGGNVGVFSEVAEFQKNPSASVRGDFNLTDADMVEAGSLTECGFTTGVRCFHYVGICALGDAERFRCKGGNERVTESKHQGDSAHDLIAIGDPVKSANAACSIFEL